MRGTTASAASADYVGRDIIPSVWALIWKSKMACAVRIHDTIHDKIHDCCRAVTMMMISNPEVAFGAVAAVASGSVVAVHGGSGVAVAALAAAAGLAAVAAAGAATYFSRSTARNHSMTSSKSIDDMNLYCGDTSKMTPL